MIKIALLLPSLMNDWLPA